MWKKDENPTTAYTPEAERPPRPEPSVPQPPAAAPASGQRASIGRSITIRGDVTGDEDLLIQGRVDGSIDLKQHAVTIGSEGEVKASIAGRVVIVEGSVEGNISSAEQVVLRRTARVQGDITAPRLVLEDGARFRGGVDMGDDLERGGAANASAGQSGSKRPAAAAATSTSTPIAGDSASKEADGAVDNGSKRKGSAEAVAEARA